MTESYRIRGRLEEAVIPAQGLPGDLTDFILVVVTGERER